MRFTLLVAFLFLAGCAGLRTHLTTPDPVTGEIPIDQVTGTTRRIVENPSDFSAWGELLALFLAVGTGVFGANKLSERSAKKAEAPAK